MKGTVIIVCIALASCKAKQPPPVIIPSDTSVSETRIAARVADTVTKRILASTPDFIAKAALMRISSLELKDSLNAKRITAQDAVIKAQAATIQRLTTQAATLDTINDFKIDKNRVVTLRKRI